MAFRTKMRVHKSSGLWRWGWDQKSISWHKNYDVVRKICDHMMVRYTKCQIKSGNLIYSVKHSIIGQASEVPFLNEDHCMSR